MIELLERLDLSQVHHLRPAVVFSLHSLDGDLLFRLLLRSLSMCGESNGSYLIVGEIDEAVGAVPHQVDHLVPPETSQGLRGLARGRG